MDNCPNCGVELSSALVASIKDPNQPEACYRKAPEPSPEKQKRLDEISAAQRRLTAYMMLGAHAAA